MANNYRKHDFVLFYKGFVLQITIGSGIFPYSKRDLYGK